jgi:spore germination protein YaaH
MFQRLAIAALAILLVGCGPSPSPTPRGDASGDPAASDPANGPTDPASGPTDATAAPATPVPAPGHEVYGYVPYWEMDATIAEHVAATPLSTLALFSVTNRSNGSIDETQNGFKRITGEVGRRMIREAHDRKVRVEIVFTSFGSARNKQLFGGTVARQDKVIASLVAFARDLGVDGINVDVESMDPEFVPSYGAFVGRLRTALRGDTGRGQVSVATTAHINGAAMAAAAAEAGADRIFMMGYDYHWAGSDPGASAPLDRRDGKPQDLAWSLDLYGVAGVPVQRTILGLPFYGMAWPVEGPELGDLDTGRGDTWIPSDHLFRYDDPTFKPTLDPIEQVDFYAIADPDVDGGWQGIYVDSPATLTPKLALADDRGLAGAGFWAIGYERGLPAFTDLVKRFADGKLD